MSTLKTTNIAHPSSASNNIVLDANGNVNIDSNTLYVDASNNRVGIGTTTVDERLHIVGNFKGVDSSGRGVQIINGATPYIQALGTSNINDLQVLAQTIQFQTGTTYSTTERARIDSSGRLLVGTSTADGHVTFKGTGTSTGFTFSSKNSADTNLVRIRDDGAVYMGLATNSPYNITTGTAANAALLGDGFLYRSTSSLKYKRNVQDAPYGLAELLKLRAVTYQGKSTADGDKVFGGLIAEEVDAVGLPEFVQYAEDGSPDALAYGNMVSLCIKAIQEQQIIIDQLKARVAALEAA